MEVVIFGGGGFIGSAIADRLLAGVTHSEFLNVPGFNPIENSRIVNRLNG